MKTTQTTSPAFSIGVHESEHTVRTVCPECKTRHRVVLAASLVEADAMQKALDRIAESYASKTATASAVYATRVERAANRPVETRHVTKVPRRRAATANEMSVALRPSEGLAAPSPGLRPRFRYFASDRRRNPVDMSPTRLKIYRLVERSTAKGLGITEADLLKKGFAHGSIQQTMHWLREAGWVKYSQEVPTVD